MLSFARALAAGIGAAAAGFTIYWAIRAATGYEFALVAILVGWMVGMAVRWGSFRRGGILYQLLAVVLTYLAIASTYCPAILQGMREGREERRAAVSTQPAADSSIVKKQAVEDQVQARDVDAPPLWLQLSVAFAISLAAPFLMGASNILGWIIIAFGLMQAWRLNKRISIQISGPFPAGARLPAHG
jgi:hypothetical protein